MGPHSATKELSPCTAAIVEIFVRATGRTRTACGLMAIFSVVCFATYNNTRPGNWSIGRVQSLSQFRTDLRKAHATDPLSDFATQDAKLKKEIDYLTQNGVVRMKELDDQIQKEREAVLSTQKVQLPLIGVTFDSNDSGLVFGFSFLVLSIFLYKCIGREGRCTMEAFETATHKKELRLAYTLMSLEEVLTRPTTLPRPNDDPSANYQITRSAARKELDKVPIVALTACLPVVSYAPVIAYDLVTFPQGWVESPASTLAVVGSELFSLIGLMFICWQSVSACVAIRKIWEMARQRAVPAAS